MRLHRVFQRLPLFLLLIATVLLLVGCPSDGSGGNGGGY